MNNRCECGEDHQECDSVEQLEFKDLITEQDLIKPKKYDFDKMKLATQLFLDAVGHPDWRKDDNTFETPTRVAKMWEVLLGGYDIDNDQHSKTFPATSDNAVFISNVPFFSMCSHHLMPFSGVINLAYIPDGKVVGLSKLPRIARTHCKRLQLQENLTKDIATDIERLLNPKGVAVQIKATHSCMSLRGVRSHGAITTTTHLSGLFKTDLAARTEFLETIKADPNVFRY